MATMQDGAQVYGFYATVLLTKFKKGYVMKTGKTLLELAEELERQQTSKHDFLADTRKMRMSPDGKDLLLENQPSAFRDFPIRDLCHSQIASRLKIPMKYYDRMRQDSPGLLADNVNHWFEHQPERRMVRTMDEEARAFLSDRYRPLDNYDMAEIVLPKIQEMECKVMSCEITERRMYLKVVTERITASIAVGDPVQAGLVISNSEVGCGSVKVEPLVYRLSCLNGMIAADHSLRKYHIGRAGGEVEGAAEFYRDETRKQDDKAFWMKVKDVVGASLDEAKFNLIVSRMQEVKQNLIEKPLEKTVELVSERFGFNETEQGSVLRHLIEGSDLSQYGLANAVTRASQDLKDYERATEFERAGGQIIELPQTDWKTIAA